MFHVCQSHFEETEDEIKAELAIEESWDGLLYIEAIDMVERFQHSDVVVQAVETAIRCFCRGGIITTHRDALDRTVEHWRKLGFRRTPRFEIVGATTRGAIPTKHPALMTIEPQTSGGFVAARQPRLFLKK